MKQIKLLIILIIALNFISAAYFYDKMPDSVASHWNAAGEVDGYMSKFWGVFLLPLVNLFMFGLFMILPNIDPLKKNIKKFKTYYDSFILVFILFMTYVYALTIAWNLGYTFNMGKFMIPAISILFFYLGIILKNTKRNWFIGIRTPWTLSSDEVWDKTHKLGSELFKISAVFMIISMFFETLLIYFVLAPILITVIILFVYSYVVSRKK